MLANLLQTYDIRVMTYPSFPPDSNFGGKDDTVT